MSADTWIMPLGHMPKYSLNQRLHWAQRAELNRVWMSAAYYEARQARIPHLTRAQIQLVYYAPDRRKRDVDNLVPAQKACVDGVVMAGVVLDDSPEHCEMLMPAIVERDDHRNHQDTTGTYVLRIVALEEDGRL